jgi:hypothetical protein
LPENRIRQKKIDYRTKDNKYNEESTGFIEKIEREEAKYVTAGLEIIPEIII